MDITNSAFGDHEVANISTLIIQHLHCQNNLGKLDRYIAISTTASNIEKSAVILMLILVPLKPF